MTQTAARPAAETMAAFARRLGVARSTITRAAQAGRLVTRPDGLVLVAESLARWHATLGPRADMAERHALARGAAIPQPPAQSPEQAASNPAPLPTPHPGAENAAGARFAALVAASAAHATGGAAQATPATAGAGQAAGDGKAAPPADGDADTDGAARAQHQAAKLHWRNEALRLEIALADGTRLPRAATLAEAQGLGALLRAAVERIIDQTAPRLAAAATPQDRRRLLQAQLASVRRQLRRELPAALRRLQPERNAHTRAQAAADAANHAATPANHPTGATE